VFQAVGDDDTGGELGNAVRQHGSHDGDVHEPRGILNIKTCLLMGPMTIHQRSMDKTTRGMMRILLTLPQHRGETDRS
jgi:hypothetical protein